MGYRSVTGLDPLPAILRVINDTQVDQPRRYEAKKRIDLYQDNGEQQTRAEITKLFAQGRRQRLYPFAALGQAKALFRRIVNEHARAAYGVPPTRRVLKPDLARDESIPDDPDEDIAEDPISQQDQKAFDELAKRCRLNAKMRLAARIVRAANATFLHFRVSRRLGMLLDVLAPHQVVVLEDPDDPTREIGIAYSTIAMMPNGSRRIMWVYWDDEEAFRVGEDGILALIEGADGKKAFRLTAANGHPGILPFVAIHLVERFGTYWNMTEGKALVAADRAQKIVLAMAVRILKVQGHQQLGIIGDIAAVSNDQLLDEEEPVKVQVGQSGIPTDVRVLAQPTDVTGHLKLDEYIGLSVAADHGLNRDQMNQQQTAATDQTGLLERRLEMIYVFSEAEPRAFEVMKVLSQSTDTPISDDAILETDFPDVASRVNALLQMQIWDAQMKAGIRSYYDNVREVFPEATTDEECEEILQRILKINTRWKSRFRALNMPIDSSIQENGKTPEENGAAGGAAAAASESAAARSGDELAAVQQKLF